MKVIYEDTVGVPVTQKAYKSYRIIFFENLKMQKVFCEGLVIENTVCTV